MVLNSILTHKRAADVVAGAQLCHIGVQSRFGPHVTPDAFALADGRLWVVTSIASVKARSIRRHPHVGVLLRSGNRSLVLTGRAEILSLWSPNEALRLALNTVPAAVALADFSMRNTATLFGYALDLCSLPSGAIPLDRVIVSVRPTEGVLLAGDEVRESWIPDHLEEGNHRDVGSPEASGVVHLPSAVADLIDDETEAAVGWSTPFGPAVLPGTWDPRAQNARVSLDALRALRAPEAGPACITFDDSAARRPTKYRGVILRGTGSISRKSARSGEVDLSLERATWWKGFETGTVHAEASRAVAEGRNVAAH